MVPGFGGMPSRDKENKLNLDLGKYPDQRYFPKLLQTLLA